MITYFCNNFPLNRTESNLCIKFSNQYEEMHEIYVLELIYNLSYLFLFCKNKSKCPFKVFKKGLCRHLGTQNIFLQAKHRNEAINKQICLHPNLGEEENGEWGGNYQIIAQPFDVTLPV